MLVKASQQSLIYRLRKAGVCLTKRHQKLGTDFKNNFSESNGIFFPGSMPRGFHHKATYIN